MAPFHLGLVCFAVVCLASITECRVCTRVVSEQKTQTFAFPGECVHTYESRCGWFSVKMCTFNETVPCMKELNRTVSIYRVVEDCCPGYGRDSEGHCMKHVETGQSRNNDDDGGKFLNISHGAYAGIVCGVLFVVCVALLIALHYRKRHMKQEKTSMINMEQEVAQKQAMIPLDTMVNTENSAAAPVNT